MSAKAAWDREKYDIAIVGSGIASVMTLLELSKLLLQGERRGGELKIAVIEKEGEFWNGIPYGRRSSINSLTIQKLAEFVDEPERSAYVEWLETHKQRWLEYVEQNGGLAAATWIKNNRALIESGGWDEIYVPRFLYGIYNSEKVASALAVLKDQGRASVTLVQAEAIDIAPGDESAYVITLTRAEGFQESLFAERVVLAVGSPPIQAIASPSFHAPQHGGYINDIYCPSEEENLKRIYQVLGDIDEKRKRNILILGSNASSLETLYLINYNPEIRALVNSIVVISRSGLLPHKICEKIPAFEFKNLELLLQKSAVSALEVITAIKADIQKAEGADVNIADLFHPMGALFGQLLRRMDISEQERFFCQHGMTFTKLMRRAGRDCREAADDLARQGILTMEKGVFCGLETSIMGKSFVSAVYNDAGMNAKIRHPSPFPVVVNCGGFEDLSRSSSSLIKNLVKRDLCKINGTNRGFLVNDQLEANRNFYVIGPLVGGNFNKKIRFWHVESAPRIQGLSKILAKSLFDSILARDVAAKPSLSASKPGAERIALS
jgi:uncharacterized NAD(P)/FAD-binding protein YdhS